MIKTPINLRKKAHGLNAQPLKDFILGSSPSVNRKLLTHPNKHTHPSTPAMQIGFIPLLSVYQGLQIYFPRRK